MNIDIGAPSCDDPKIERMFDLFWMFRLKSTPEFATSIGIHIYDDKLDNLYEVNTTLILLTCQEYLQKVRNFDRETCTTHDRRLLEAFEYELTTFIDGYKYKGFYFPISHLEGPQINFEELIQMMPKYTLKDFKNILSRYGELPNQIKCIIELMKNGVDSGMTLSAHSLKGVHQQLLRVHSGEVERSPFYQPFLMLPPSISHHDAVQLKSKARELILSCVMASFRRLDQYLFEEYVPFLRPEIAITSIPCGVEYYKQCLLFHTGTEMTPEEIHELGLQEVVRIHAEMLSIIRNLGLSCSVSEFSERLRKDSSMSFKTKSEMKEEYSFILEQQIWPKLNDLFSYRPQAQLEVGFISESSPSAPSAFYRPTDFNRSRPAGFLLNASENLANNFKFEMTTLTLHEGNPGHHLHTCFLQETPGIPFFLRKRETSRKYNIAPSRFPLHTAFLEGWALYAETLGDEMGLFNDPYSRYGHLSEEIFRACRLVVDTGLHAFNWTRERAVLYMKQYTAASLVRIVNDVDRYITWPGQACSYKIGQLKIQEQRKMAQKLLGRNFDIKVFHNAVLQLSTGSIKQMEENLIEMMM